MTDSTADAGEGGPEGFGWAGTRVIAGHGDPQIEEALDRVVVAGAPVASHQLAETMSMPGIVEDGEQLDHGLSGSNTEANPVADDEAAVCVGHQLEPDLSQAAVNLGDGGACPLQGPAHPCRQRRRRGCVAQARDQGAAVAGVVGTGARRRVVDTRRRADQGDEALADGVAAR